MAAWAIRCYVRHPARRRLKHLLVHDVALIMLDVQMPGMDGYETAAHIKSRERSRHVPIIFLTAIDREAHQAYRGYAVGAVDFLAKPFDPWVLRAKVEVFVELHRAREQMLRQTEALRERAGRLGAAPVAAALDQVERLLIMDGRAATESGPAAEALELLRRLRRDLEVAAAL